MDRRVVGIILIFLGLLFLLSNFNILPNEIVIDMSTMWPLFILIPGILLEKSYFDRKKDPRLLVPGGILIVVGLLFFFEIFTNWIYMQYTWPIFILAVAFGLFQLYIFGKRESILLIPIIILTTVAVISILAMVYERFLTFIGPEIIIAVVLILIGLIILIQSFSKSR